jgi:uncharacterized protein
MRAMSSLAWLLFGVTTLACADSSLATLARDGEHDAAMQMIAHAGELDVADEDGSTALQWAAHRDDAALVDALLHAGADVRRANDYGATALGEAAVLGNVRVMSALLKAGADADSANARGQTALMLVARTSNVEAARLLLKHGAHVNAVETVKGQTALMWAAAQSQPEMVRVLLKAGADPAIVSVVPQHQRQVSGEPRAQHRLAGGFTALLFATRQGCFDCVKALVEKGANIEQADPEGITPLITAIDNFNFDTAAWLLAHGANPNIWDWWGRTPLYLAVDLNTVPRGGRSDMPSLDKTTSLQLIEQLLKAGANPNMQLKLFPPYRAVGPDRGADQMLTRGATPLLRAAKAADVPAIRLLLAHGAKPDLPQLQGISAVMAAAGLGSSSIDTRGSLKTQPQMIEALGLLLAAGGNVNQQDIQGRTALHAAAQAGYTDVVRALAAGAARLDAKDARGFTALDYASGRGAVAGRGAAPVVREETAKVLQELQSAHP